MVGTLRISFGGFEAQRISCLAAWGCAGAAIRTRFPQAMPWISGELKHLYRIANSV